MKYLSKFNTDSEYLEKKNGFEEVNVSWINEVDEVRYYLHQVILTPGYFLLNDGSEVNPSGVNDENRSKIVGYILDNSGSYSGKNIIVAINSSIDSMYWSESLNGTDVPGLTNYEYDNRSEEPYKDKNGKYNTQIVVDYFNSNSMNLNESPSFNYCITYSPGYKDSEWYLPSMGELKLFYDNREKFREDCNLAGITTNMNSDNSGSHSFWSSTERSIYDSWICEFDDSSYYGGKYYQYDYVVPFLAID